MAIFEPDVLINCVLIQRKKCKDIKKRFLWNPLEWELTVVEFDGTEHSTWWNLDASMP